MATIKGLSGKIIQNIQRPKAALLKELRQYSTTIVSDCLQRFSVMDAAIKPVVSGVTVVGPAITVEEVEGGNLMSHFALDLLQPGDVLVIDQKRVTSRAGWGGLQTYIARKKKVSAVIVDGAVRDVADIRKLGVPVFCRAVSPAGPHKGWGGYVNTTVSCGGVPVVAGDIIVADDDGIVVVQQKKLTALLAACRKRLAMEKDWYRWVDQGKSTADFMGFHKKREELGIEFISGPDND